MREIKFRAWEPDAKEMVYFDNLKASKDPYIASHLCALMANEHPKGSGLLMQFTGLTDCEGVEVYEGDIIKHSNGRIGIVEYDVDSISFQTNNNGNVLDQEQGIYPEHMQVIGNIHQHNNLLDVAIED